MSGFFQALRDRVDVNARRAVATYTEELPDYREAAQSPGGRAAMLDFAVLLRRREAELGADDSPFTETDLAILRRFGEERGASGVSLSAQRRVLGLHSVLTLREIQEAAGPNDVDPMMRMLAWLPANGLAAQRAYTQGYLDGQKRFLPGVQRVQHLAGALLADSSVAGDLAESLGMPLAADYLVLVVRVTGGPLPGADVRRELFLDQLLGASPVPMAWPEAAPEAGEGEFVALLPIRNISSGPGPGPGTEGGSGLDAAEQRALGLAGDVARLAGRPCAAGTARGRTGALAEAAALARRISRVAPAERVPRRLHALRDVFVELGVTELPQIESWLRRLAGRLVTGPDLVTTLDAFYRHDMNRLNTAGTLHIHPRTLDYRLHRVRELTGMDPGSTRGVRTLSTVVARLLAGRWADLSTP